MAKGNVYITKYPDNPPEWYWTAGLHDACIVGVEAVEMPFDYREYVREKRYTRNQLTLKIDASGALFDNKVREIRLYNYKILAGTMEGRSKVWWLGDRLSEHGDGYILEIDLQDFDADPEDFVCKIQFDRAEVKR